jgi:hypothetical protein
MILHVFVINLKPQGHKLNHEILQIDRIVNNFRQQHHSIPLVCLIEPPFR